ncbi:divalent cation tolerance protein CutA [Streptomyces sp. KL116D]|uniref:divalent cation tolerance protein CutA n=1 Tax=Streptomyces sp. KL116D TaxID=3045152 RepID=UPI003555F8C5
MSRPSGTTERSVLGRSTGSSSKRADCYTKLEEFILAHHPWERPELNAVIFSESSADFRDWVDRNLG